jgi:hypothetical protein
MKKKNLKTLKINKQLISKENNNSVTGGGMGPGPLYTIVIECLTEECPTESQEGFCYTVNPLRCIAPPNPA